MTTRPWTCPTCGAEYELVSGRVPPSTKPADEDLFPEEPITEQQGKAIYAIREDLVDGKARLKQILAEDYHVATFDDLTKKQASELISRLQRMLRATGQARSRQE